MHKNRPYLATFGPDDDVDSISQIASTADQFKSDLKPTFDDLGEQLLEFEAEPLADLDDPSSGSDIVIVDHSMPPEEALLKLIQSSLLTDVVVKVHNREFQCHSIVLHIYSRRLKPLLQRPVIEIRSNRLTPRGFSLAYQWMISTYGTLNGCDVADLLRAATYLEVPELLEHCWATLDRRIFNEFTAFDVMYQARKIEDLAHMNEPLAARISKALLTIVSSSEYLELNEMQMCSLLSSSNLAVNSEVEVLFSALLWLDHQWPLRESKVGSILKNIRFGFLAPTILSKFKTKERHKIGPFAHILETFCSLPDMSKLIHDGLFYSSLVITSCNDPKFFRDTVQQNKLAMVPARRWMCDGRCSYHRPICKSYPNMRHLNFEDFADYLLQLQTVDEHFDSQMSFAHGLTFHDWHHEYVSSPSNLSIDLLRKHVKNYAEPALPNGYPSEILQKAKHWNRSFLTREKWQTKKEEDEDKDEEDPLKIGDTKDLLVTTSKERAFNSIFQA